VKDESRGEVCNQQVSYLLQLEKPEFLSLICRHGVVTPHGSLTVMLGVCRIPEETYWMPIFFPGQYMDSRSVLSSNKVADNLLDIESFITVIHPSLAC
jgi:hypothetical protein